MTAFKLVFWFRGGSNGEWLMRWCVCTHADEAALDMNTLEVLEFPRGCQKYDTILKHGENITRKWKKILLILVEGKSRTTG